MITNCPNCGVAYDIDQALIPEGGRKLRCSNCGEIFLCRPQMIEESEKPAQEIEESAKLVKEDDEVTEIETEIQEEEEAESEVEPEDEPLEEGLETVEDDMQMIFQRLSEEKKELKEQEKKISFFSKLVVSVNRFLGVGIQGVKGILIFVVVVLLVSALYYSRYDIVRKVPQAQNLYDLLKLKAAIPGEGLVFTNISRREYEIDGVMHMEIKGFIDNHSIRKIDVPDIRVEILDKNADLLQTVDVSAPINKIPSNNKAAFRVIIPKPSVLSKYILITFGTESTAERHKQPQIR